MSTPSNSQNSSKPPSALSPSGSAKRVVIWGTGVVGSMIIAEILDNPVFELVGVGVSNPDKVGRDVGELVGARRAGVTCTDDVDSLIALRPDALVHFGPSAAHADDNIALLSAFLRAGIDVCSTAMTPWVWPHAEATPREWVEPIEEACREGGASCFTTGIDPGFANDLLPITLMGVAGRVDTVRVSELLDYTAYEGDYEDEMGIGHPPEFSPILEVPEVLIMAWGGTIPMIAHSVGIELDSLRTEWEKWVTPEARDSAKGTIAAGHVAAVRFQIHGVYRGRDVITIEHVNRIGRDAAPEWPRGTADDVYRVDITGSLDISQETAFRFGDGSGRSPAVAGCLATGMRALNAVHAVGERPPGWVTALDLPPIAGRGAIR